MPLDFAGVSFLIGSSTLDYIDQGVNRSRMIPAIITKKRLEEKWHFGHLVTTKWTPMVVEQDLRQDTSPKSVLQSGAD